MDGAVNKSERMDLMLFKFIMIWLMLRNINSCSHVTFMIASRF